MPDRRAFLALLVIGIVVVVSISVVILSNQLPEEPPRNEVPVITIITPPVAPQSRAWLQ